AEFYEGAVRLAPADGAVWYNMGLYWQRAGLLKEAISAYRQAISRDAELAYAYNNLGLCLMLTGKVREAGEVLNAGLQKDQRSPDIHFNLALVYRTIGDNAKAESYLERAKALAPERKHIQVTVEELDDWLERMH
ncbi:MAG TPA: tetratricopeptide repeat protein, partial [bacterium]|nr:tetratricopeptide repeat protein [bacterium]